MASGDEKTSGRTTTENFLSSPIVRRLFQDGEGVQTIPELGDFHPDLTTLQVVKRRITQFDDHPTQQLYDIEYERVDVDFVTTTPTAAEDLPRRMQIGGEWLLMDKNSGMFWSALEPAVQPFQQRIATGTLHVEQIRTTSDVTGIIEKAGMLNSVAFEGQPRGVWQYLGADREQFRDKDGVRLWRTDHTFAFRKVTFLNGADLDGWDFLVREVGQGQQPVIQRLFRGPALDEIFQYAAFEPLLTSKSA